MQGSRIPADKSSLFDAWDVPEVKEGEIVRVEKLQRRGPRGEPATVDRQEVLYQSLTVGQLEEISNQAYEEVREQAHQEGLKQGYDEGYKAGMAAGQQALQQQVNSMAETIDAMHNYLGGQDDEVEQALVNVATCIAHSVLRRELATDSSAILQVVGDAVAALPMDSENICVYLSEQDHQLLGAMTELPSAWQLRIDRNLSPGGCRVETRHSVVDYTLEEQFQQAVNSIVEQRFAELAQQSRERNRTGASSGSSNNDPSSTVDT